MTDDEDAVDEHDDEIQALAAKWSIPREEAQRLWENQHYDE